EREKRSITLEQISISTKIGTRMLQALEEDKFSQLPGGIFNKGFVRAYARHVGLDEEQAIAEYLDASGERAAPASGIELQAMAEQAEARRARSRPMSVPWGVFAAILLIVALGLSLWNRSQHAPAKESTPPPKVEKIDTGLPHAQASASP